MKFDVTLFPNTLREIPEHARAAEEMGVDGMWTSETAHNPFLPIVLAAEHSKTLELGTGIAVAFPRSPMVTAQAAWDLAEQSGGRFMLGLGTQVKAHITKRFSTSWDAPVDRLREYIQSVRAIWSTFQTNTPLRYEGQHYRFTLMTPFFNPGKMDHPNIPIYIAGVNEGLCQLAGETCEGFHVHSFHTPQYLRELIIPAIEQGAQKAGRTRADVALACGVFVVTGDTEEERQNNSVMVRSQIAFYASTPSYRAVMDMHGWQDLHEELNAMSRQNRWFEMGEKISDEMLNTFAVVATAEDLPHALHERYAGLLDRVTYYMPFKPEEPENRRVWEIGARAFKDMD